MANKLQMNQRINTEPEGLISQSLDAGFILLSYLVSFAGCAVCLELLHRRTASVGYYNWFLLVTSALAMGGIGIWCMHFIGDRAISLHNETDTTVEILYNAGFTALSFILPVLVLTAGLYSVGVCGKPVIWRICLAGTLIGAAVCGMHYIGEVGITNYEYSYAPFNIVGATIIAVSASIIALGAFFRFRESWSSSWWKRSLSASLLAAAVSGMHWTAAAGTYYHRPLTDGDVGVGLTSTQTAVACAALASVACLFLLALGLLEKRQARQSANRVHQLVLACAYFDPSGSIMVSPGGSLPNCKITNHYTFADDQLSKTNAAFIWAFKASRNWPAVLALVPGMRHHLVNNALARSYCPGHDEGESNAGNESEVDFELVFKELFCVAAQELATQINQRLDKMGVLFDDIMTTGTHVRRPNLGRRFRRVARSSDPEAGEVQPVIGKGQCLFIVRHLDTREAVGFSASGHRFAPIPQITHNLARTMQVPHSDMRQALERMKHYSFLNQMMEPGVHLVCFSLTPRLHGGFDILVPKEAPNALPHKQLPIAQLSQWQQDILTRMDGLTLPSFIRWLKENAGECTKSEQVEFCEQLRETASKLASYIVDADFGLAKFSCQPIKIPCKPMSQVNEPAHCTAFTFHLINGLQARVLSPRLCLSPLRLFNAQQQVYPGDPDHEHFYRTILDEFAHCIQHDATGKPILGSLPLDGCSTPSSAHRHSFTSSFRNSLLSLKSSLQISDSETQKPQPRFGGIVVTNEVTVDVTERPRRPTSSGDKDAPTLEMDDLHTAEVEGGYTRGRPMTFVDELFALCRPQGPDMRRQSYYY